MNSRSRNGMSCFFTVLSVGLLVTTATAWDEDRSNETHKNTSTPWASNNPPGSRFTTVFPGAVLDKNTGLVWEQAPSAPILPVGGPGVNYFTAAAYCVNKTVGGTVGWRLPSVIELMSVQGFWLSPSTFSGAGGPTWSSTTVGAMPYENWTWVVINGNVEIGVKGDEYNVWCVRGAMQADAY